MGDTLFCFQVRKSWTSASSNCNNDEEDKEESIISQSK